MPNSDDEVLSEIKQAWVAAQQQLADLRAAVERASEAARKSLLFEATQSAREKALRDLGDAVSQLVRAGKWTPPEDLHALLKAVDDAEKARTVELNRINDLLDEGAALAERLHSARPGPAGTEKTPLALPKKKG